MPANVTVVAGTTPVDVYLGNYTYASAIATGGMEALRVKLATDLNRLVYSNAARTFYKVMSDASTTANHPASRVVYTDANGAGQTAAGFGYDGTTVSVSVAGTVKETAYPVVVKNTTAAADRDGTGVGIDFRLTYHATSTEFTAGDIAFIAEDDFNKLTRFVLRLPDNDGELMETLRISEADIQIGGDPDTNWTAGQMATLNIDNDHVFAKLKAQTPTGGGLNVMGYTDGVTGLIFRSYAAGTNEESFESNGSIKFTVQRLVNTADDTWVLQALSSNEVVSEVINYGTELIRTFGNAATEYSWDGNTHEMTDIATDGTFFRIENRSGCDGVFNTGGVRLTGLSSSISQTPMEIHGVIGVTDPTDTTAAVLLTGSKKNTTSDQALGAAETVVDIDNYTTNLVSIKGNGDITTIGDITVNESKGIYFGSPATDGTWLIARNGNNIIFQRRESGSYVTKQTLTP